MSEIHAKGAKLLAPLPEPLQLWTVYSAAVPASSAEPADARAFIAALTAPAMRSRWTADGWEPRRDGTGLRCARHSAGQASYLNDSETPGAECGDLAVFHLHVHLRQLRRRASRAAIPPRRDGGPAGVFQEVSLTPTTSTILYSAFVVFLLGHVPSSQVSEAARLSRYGVAANPRRA